MNLLMFNFMAGAPATGQPNMLSAFLPFILILVIFYFLLIIPQKKERKKHEEMLNNLKPGDYVLTNAGIYGTIVKITEEKAVLRIADGVKIEVLKNTIAGPAPKKD